MTGDPESSAERVQRQNEFAKPKHPGMVGVVILRADADEVVGRLDITTELVAGTGFLWAPVVITLADWLCAVGIGANLPEGASFTTIELKTNWISGGFEHRTGGARDQRPPARV